MKVRSMTDRPDLAVAFLERRPLAAARTLTQMDPRDAASFLDTLPTRIAVNALARMGAYPAAMILSRMTPAVAASVLQGHDYRAAATILRLIPVAARAPIMEKLSLSLKRRFEASLSFPPGTVGAQMTVSLIVMKPENTVADGKIQIRRHDGAMPELLFLVGDDRRLLGAVQVVLLLRYLDNVTLAEIMEDGAPALSARASVASVSGLAAWNDYAMLPVVSRQKHLIGGLTRQAARQKLDGGTTVPGAANQSFLSGMGEAFLDTAIGLGELLADVDAPPQSLTRSPSQRTGPP